MQFFIMQAAGLILISLIIFINTIYYADHVEAAGAMAVRHLFLLLFLFVYAGWRCWRRAYPRTVISQIIV